MKVRIGNSFVCAALLAVCGGSYAQKGSYTPELPLQREERPAAELKAHGVGLEAADLVRFLKEGIPKGTPIPDEPVEKSQLSINAMARLAHLKAKEAVPVLKDIANQKMPGGVMQLLQHDLGKTAPETREQFRAQAMKLLQYNAINALSIIGDSSSAGLMRSAMSNEAEVGARIQYAICLGMVGDASGVDYLVQVINAANRRESAAAARAFTIVTGQDFGYTEHTPIKARRSRAQLYGQWWGANRGSFKPDREEVLDRRANPPIHATYEARNTRDLLKLASNYFDFRNTGKSYEARQALADAGAGLNRDLERIASDENEDLNIRMEAMNWYFTANRSSARSLFRKLRRDSNPEIMDKAQTLLDQIEEESRPVTVNQPGR